MSFRSDLECPLGRPLDHCNFTFEGRDGPEEEEFAHLRQRFIEPYSTEYNQGCPLCRHLDYTKDP